MSEPATKKPRSEAQIAAFEKARKAREDNLRKKFAAEAAAQRPTTPEPEPEPEHGDSEESAPQPQPSVPAQKEQQPSPMEVEQEHESEIVDFDPESFRNELYEKLHAANAQIEELKKHVHGVRSQQEELQSSWQKHGVRTSNMLNFV